MPDQPGVAPAPVISPGQEQLLALSTARNQDGSPAFSDAYIKNFRDQGIAKMQAARNADGTPAFSTDYINKYYGMGAPPTNVPYVSRNQQAAGMTVAHGPVENFVAGLGIGDVGVGITTLSGGKTTLTPDQHGSILDAGAAAIGQGLSDAPVSVPAFIGGTILGASAGGSIGAGGAAAATGPEDVPGEVGAGGVGAAIGGLVGGGAASGGVSEGVRQTFLTMQHSDEIHNLGDFLHAVGAASINTVQAAASSAAMNVVAGPFRGVATKVVGKFAGAVIGDAAAAATGVGVGAALTQHMPSTQDWFAAAAMVLVQHGAGHLMGTVKNGVFRPSEQTSRVAANMQDTWRRTGITPWQQQELANRDPKYAAEIMGQDVNGDPSTPHLNRIAPPEPEPHPSQVTGPKTQPGEDEGGAFVREREAAVAKDRVAPAVGSGNARIEEPMTRSQVQALEGSTTYAVSNKGAIGRNQITIGAARTFGFGEGMSDAQVASWLKDDHNNDAVADKFIAWANEHYRGDTNAALVSYNAGPKWASQYLTAGPGTALEAVKDPSTRSGWAYHSIPAERDESFLPPETQRYLAHARELAGVKADPETLRAPKTEVTPESYPGAHIVTNHRGEQVPLVTLHTRSGQSYQVNARFAKNFQGFTDDLEAAGYHIHTVHGYQDRDVAGVPGRPSFHDQGAAIDVNGGKDNPFIRGNRGLVNDKVVTDMPRNVQQIAEKWGLGWGGAWATEKDAMHFSIASEEGGSVSMSRRAAGGPGGPPARVPAAGEGEPPEPPAGGRGPPAPPPGGRPPALAAEPEGPKKTVDELYDSVDANIGEPDKAPSLWATRFLTQNFSELTPAYNVDRALVDGDVIDTTKDIGIEDMARQTYASDQRTAYFIQEGPLKIGPKDEIQPVKNGTSINDALEEAKKNGTFDRWVKWMVAVRADNQHKAGLETGFDEQDMADLAADKGERAKYGKATAMLNDTLNHALAYARDSGVLSQEQMDAIIKANPIYVSFRRMMGEDGIPGGPAGKKFAARNPLYNYEGSDRKIADPFGATIDNMRVLIAMADRNRLAGAIVGLAKSGKYPGEIEAIQTKDMNLKALPDSTSQALQVYGMGSRGIGDNGGPAIDPEEEANTWSAFAERQDSQQGAFRFLNNGKPEFWKVKDPLLGELLTKPVTPGSDDIVLKVFGYAARLERAGIVTNPDFAPRVTLRHEFYAFITDPQHPAPIMTTVVGAIHQLGRSDQFKEWWANGGAGATMQEMDINYLKKDFDQLSESTGLWSRVANAVDTPVQWAQLIAEKLSMSPRIGRYVLGRSRGESPMKAAMMSRTTYIDYAERATGVLSNGLAQATPFWRPKMLTARGLYKAFTERPLTTSAFMVGTVMLPGLATYIINRAQDQFLDEEDKYENLPRWIRDNYLVSPLLPGGNRIKLQMPYYLGFMFKAIPERFFDYMSSSDPHAWNEFAQGFMHEYLPGIDPASLPTLIQTPLELGTNHNFFTGHTIVPDRLAQRNGYMQYTPNTTDLSKAVASYIGKGPGGIDVANASPIQLEFLLKGYGGQATADALAAANAVIRGSSHGQAPAGNLGDNYFVRAFFVRRPDLSAQPIQDFYRDFNSMAATHADWVAATKGGTQQQLGPGEKSPPWYALAQLNTLKLKLTTNEKLIQGITDDPNMSPASKAQNIELLVNDSIGYAKAGTRLVQQANAGKGVTIGDLF